MGWMNISLALLVQYPIVSAAATEPARSSCDILIVALAQGTEKREIKVDCPISPGAGHVHSRHAGHIRQLRPRHNRVFCHASLRLVRSPASRRRTSSCALYGHLSDLDARTLLHDHAVDEVRVRGRMGGCGRCKRETQCPRSCCV